MRRGELDRRGRASDGFEPIVPVGEGIVARRLRMRREDVQRLGIVLSGYDGLASLHGGTDDVVYVVTTVSQSRTLDEVLENSRRTIPFERAERGS